MKRKKIRIGDPLYAGIWVLIEKAWDSEEYTGYELLGLLERIKLELKDGIDQTHDVIHKEITANEKKKLIRKHEMEKDNITYVG